MCEEDRISIPEYIKKEYVEVKPDLYAQFELEDTLMIRIGAKLPNYYLRIGSVTTKEKYRKMAENSFDKAVNLLRTGVRTNDKIVAVKALQLLIKVQKEFHTIFLDLTLTEEERIWIRQQLMM